MFLVTSKSSTRTQCEYQLLAQYQDSLAMRDPAPMEEPIPGCLHPKPGSSTLRGSRPRGGQARQPQRDLFTPRSATLLLAPPQPSPLMPPEKQRTRGGRAEGCCSDLPSPPRMQRKGFAWPLTSHEPHSSSSLPLSAAALNLLRCVSSVPRLP